MMLLPLLICSAHCNPTSGGVATVKTNTAEGIGMPMLCIQVPIHAQQGVPNTYSLARFRSVSIHSLCCHPAALFRSPVYSLPSLWTEDHTIKGEGRNVHDAVCSRLQTERALPCSAIGWLLYESDADVTLQSSAHCLLSTSTYAPLRSFDSAWSIYAAPLPCILQLSSHDAPAVLLLGGRKPSRSNTRMCHTLDHDTRKKSGTE